MIKNNLLFILLIVVATSLVVSLSYERGLFGLTGYASSGTAITSVNLTQEISIAVTGNIDFGTGRVNADAPNATLDSNAGTVTGGSWTPIEDYINIENDGTVNITLNVTAEEDNNAAGLIGGTSPEFKIKGNITESGACAGTLVQTWTSMPNSTESPINICNLLNFAQSSDEFNVSVKLSIPNDAEAGSRNATLTFSASCVGAACP